MVKVGLGLHVGVGAGVLYVGIIHMPIPRYILIYLISFGSVFVKINNIQISKLMF